MLTEYEAQKLQADLRRDSHAPPKQRLLRDMRNEPVWRLGVALKCAVCLVILAGLALIGTSTDLQSEPSFGATVASGSAQDRQRESGVAAKKTFDAVVKSERQQQPISPPAEKARSERATVSAEHHRKAVFDERRRAWEERRYNEDKKIAGGKTP